MSPGTSSLAGRMLSSPSRRTRAVGARMFRRASREDWAFFSWTMPMTALTTTMVPMTMASVHSAAGQENRAAPMRMRTIGSSSCSFCQRRMDLGGFPQRIGSVGLQTFGCLGIPQAVLRGMKGFIDLGEGLGVPRLGFGMIHVGSTTPFVV